MKKPNVFVTKNSIKNSVNSKNSNDNSSFTNKLNENNNSEFCSTDDNRFEEKNDKLKLAIEKSQTKLNSQKELHNPTNKFNKFNGRILTHLNNNNNNHNNNNHHLILNTNANKSNKNDSSFKLPSINLTVKQKLSSEKLLFKKK